MLQLRETRLFKSTFEILASGTAIQEEGCALVYVKEQGETRVQLSTGTDGEKLAGIALVRNIPPALVPLFETVVVAADGSFVLTRAPSGDQFLVKNGNAALTPEAAAPTDVTQVQIVGANGFVMPALAGKKLTVQYLYAPTVAEARTLIGDAPYGGIAPNQLGTVGVIKQGSGVGTSFFDASKDWTDVLFAKLGTGGRFVPATAATGIPNITVKNSPNAANPFLIVELNLG